MKKTIISFLVLVCFQCTFQVKAQHRYLENNPIWVIHKFDVPPNYNCISDGGEQYFYLKGDTLLGSYTYHKLFYKELNTHNCPPNPIGYNGSSDTIHPYGYLRDTLKQIRYWDVSNGGDSALYDFNLNIGDSVFPGVYYNWCRMKIRKIDSIPISNFYRKRFTFADPTGSTSAYLYEGIGWQTGLFPNSIFCPNVSTLTVYNLTCYGINDTAWYPNYNAISPCTVPNFTIGIKEPQEYLKEISIYPNPVTSQTTITFSEEQKNTTITITDLLGKQIKTLTFTGKELTIDKEKMKEGVYFVSIVGEKRNIVYKKIIIQ